MDNDNDGCLGAIFGAVFEIVFELLFGIHWTIGVGFLILVLLVLHWAGAF